ncbi:hypothetical protein ScPMuIL_012307, partial [Solemya velum]
REREGEKEREKKDREGREREGMREEREKKREKRGRKREGQRERGRGEREIALYRISSCKLILYRLLLVHRDPSSTYRSGILRAFQHIQG